LCPPHHTTEDTVTAPTATPTTATNRYDTEIADIIALATDLAAEAQSLRHTLALIAGGRLLVQIAHAGGGVVIVGDRMSLRAIVGPRLVCLPRVTIGTGAGECDECGADACCAHIAAAEIMETLVSRSTAPAAATQEQPRAAGDDDECCRACGDYCTDYDGYCCAACADEDADAEPYGDEPYDYEDDYRDAADVDDADVAAERYDISRWDD